MTAGQATRPPVYFDFETGAPVACAHPQPDVFNTTALQVLEVLSDVAGQVLGDSGTISLEAALKAAEIRGFKTDALFLDLWRSASDELSVMRAEAMKKRMDER